MGRYSLVTDGGLALALLTAERELDNQPNPADWGRNHREYWVAQRDEALAEQRRRADRIIVKHIGRSTWQGTQSEWEKRV